METYRFDCPAFEAPVTATDDNVLRGIHVIRMGEARGHDLEVDGTTLDQVVMLGNQAAQGVKSRFGHPNTCNPGIGTAMGRTKNFRRHGNTVLADLHFSSAAPPDAKRHILAAAKDDPGLIGSSIVFAGTEEKRTGKGADGKPLRPLIRVNRLDAVDVVDDPAATDGLFGAPIEGIALSARDMVGLRDALQNKEFVERALSVLRTQAKALGVGPATPSPEGDDGKARVRFFLDVVRNRPALTVDSPEYPGGLLAVALESDMTQEAFLLAALDLAEKRAALAELEAASAAVDVPSVAIPEESPAPVQRGRLEKSYFNRFRKLGYSEAQAKDMAAEAAAERI